MPSKKWFPFMITIFLSLGVFSLVHAQAESLSVEITKPSEGETLYAGPETLMYCINIEGLVSVVEDPTSVQVVLEIIQNDVVIKTTTTIPDENGVFIIPATVNPEGSEGSFTAVEVEAGCENCHYRASLDLPSKGMLIRVTATTPDGQEATAEREIIVDLSGYATVPIRVILKDSQETVLSGITIQGATRLYEWRARHPSAVTDENGLAQMRVEALSEAPTRYIFQIAPTIIDGVLYQGVAPLKMTIPPGGTSAEKITLQAYGVRGNLNGQFYSNNVEITKPIKIWAIHLPDGRSYQAISDAHGKFKFSEIHYGSYLLTTDPWELAEEHLSSKSQILDLTQSENALILMPILQITGITSSGNVVDEKDDPIPFAQITIEEIKRSQRTLPSNGTWTFFNLPDQSLTLTVSAPGYFSTKITVSTSVLKRSETLELELKRRPETGAFEWGEGEVIIPPETNATVEPDQIDIKQGWLWGSGQGQISLSIRTPSVEITLDDGSFALEVPAEGIPWFYLWQGDAIIERTEDGFQVEVQNGEMITLSSSGKLIPIPIDPLIDASFHADSELRISPVWEKSLGEQIKTKLASISTSVIQSITFITYVIGLLLLIIMPIWALIRWRKKR